MIKSGTKIVVLRPNLPISGKEGSIKELITVDKLGFGTYLVIIDEQSWQLEESDFKKLSDK